jgi:hypothetical protein
MVLVDSHVHVHACFDPAAVFDAAAHNFALAAHDLAPGADFRGVLCLAETSRADYFSTLTAAQQSIAARNRGARWAVQPTSESVSLLVRDSGEQLVVIAGRQIVTRERLEVLALGTTERFPDGEPIDATLEAVVASGALAVLPWGVGKWHGARGQVIDRLLATSAGDGNVHLGDNGNRPEIGSTPERFLKARAAGMRVLPGSDPLPLRGEEQRVGAYGFALEMELGLENPAAELFAALRGTKSIIPFGRREQLSRFMRNQLAMQLRRSAAA